MLLKRIFKTAGCLIFVAVLFLPLIQQHYNVIDLSAVRLRERRRLASLPSLNPTSVFKWPQKFDDYFQDNFGFRELLIKTANSIRYHVFRVSTRDNVLIGREGWLFYGQPDKRHFFRGIFRYSERELRLLRNVYKARHAFLKAHGIKYLIVVVPNKDTVYPEFYSPNEPKVSEMNALEQFLEFLGPTTSVPIVYLKEPLLQAKSEFDEKLYLTIDSHWNDLGAFVGYQAIARKLQKHFPQIDLVSMDEYDKHYRRFGAGFANMLGVFSRPFVMDPILTRKGGDPWMVRAREERNRKRQKLNDRTLPLIIHRDFPIKGKEEDLSVMIPKAIVYRDSFFTRVNKFFSRHFVESHYYTTRYHHFDPALILREMPTIVIEQFTDHDMSLPDPAEVQKLRAFIAQRDES